MAEEHLLYVGGAWVPASGGKRIPVVDPATEEVVGEVPAATEADVDAALAAAARGFAQWRHVDAWTRSATLRRVAELIRERADDIAAVMTAEQGKPLGEARGEVLAAADQFDWYADEARRAYGRMISGHSRDQRLFTLRQPVGPVAAFTPWNFPFLLPARKVAPALAAGCSVVLKPASEAPLTALRLAAACHDAGVPAGVVNVLTGDAALISERLVASGTIRKVSLTGSLPVGQQLLRQCADRIIPATLELGGHAPVLVYADADIAQAAQTCVQAKFRNCGQVCISPTRFYVQRPALAEFTAAVVEQVSRLRIGPGADAATDVGPLANRRRLEATEQLVADAVAKGATVAAGGRRPAAPARGYFYEPTVLTDVTDEMELMHTEPFGPLLPVVAFTDGAEGIERANSSPFGLAGYVFTRATATAFEASEALEVGLVGVNNLVIATAEAPFGGIKESGYGREGGSEGIDPYLVTKYVNIRP